MKDEKEGKPMRPRRGFRPALGEALEPRLTLSHQAAAVALASHPLHLVGLIQGTTLMPPVPPDVGAQLVLHGSGTVAPLGRVAAAGFLHLSGFIVIGQDQGALVLTSARGSVTLALHRTVNHASASPVVPPFQFTIVASTGALRHATGSGLAYFAQGGPIVCVGPGPAGCAAERGSFLLSFNEPLPPVSLPL